MSRTTHKYKAVATMVDGIRFHSKKEARRWQELQLLLRAGEIHSVLRQVAFPLVAVAEADGSRFLVGRYVADFTYCERNSAALVVEDVKGFQTPLYRWKCKHMLGQYGIVIREI
jgi:hypothetical protein